jgi:ribosome-binding protein aMBF1 (putative translation factor)
MNRFTMPRSTKTGLDKFFDEQMKSPTFAKSYGEARAEVDAIDRMVRALDAAREASGLSNADLAAAIEARPEVVRRLFTTKNPNPTLSTLVRLASAVGYRVELVRNASPRRTARRGRKA